MEQPNILLIFPDQWRYDCLSVLGHPVVETPCIDQLAHQGVLFTHAYTPVPSCIAARAALATGMTPNSCGRLGYRDFVPWPYPNTFMRLLRDGGYQTLCAGKTHFHPARARLGFEELALYEMLWQDPEHPSDYHQWVRRESGGAVSDTGDALDSNSCLVHAWTEPERLHPNAWTAGAALDMLERRDPTRPFFLQVGFHRPHPPFDPPIAYFERYLDKPLPPMPVGDWAAGNDHPVDRIDPSSGRLAPDLHDRARRAYFAQIAHLDYQVGRICRHLKGRGLLRNTWIFFASDHGEMLGDHHLFRKTVPFEGSAHIPLVVKPPDGVEVPRGRRCDAPVSLEDFAPTFLDLAGIEPPAETEGLSFLEAACRPDAPARREFVHGEHAPGWQYVTDGREKLAWFSKDDRRWFFDLEEDPHELRNLAGAPQARERVRLWEQRLVEVLARRPEDGLSDGRRLIPGGSPPAVRPWLLSEAEE